MVMLAVCRPSFAVNRTLRGRNLCFPFCPCNQTVFTTTLSFTPNRKPSKSKLSLFCSISSSPSMESPPEGYRRNVGICLINPSNKVFAASRLDVPNAWQMPQIQELATRARRPCLATTSDLSEGGIDDNEDPRTAAIRELKEETGVTSAEILSEVPYWLTYDFPPEVREKLKKQWGSDWKGQAQKWFLLKFTGNDDEINLSGDGTEKPEFGAWSWMTPERVTELAVDFKRPVYKEVLEAFKSHLQQTKL